MLANYLSRDPTFTYATTAAVPPGDQDLVDFFLFDPAADRTGYCQYFASAMVIMARSLGLPARLAAGFAPGERQEDDTFLVREANAHAWAEIYFPGYGWEIFEATKSINPRFGRASGDATTPVTPPLDGGRPAARRAELLEELRVPATRWRCRRRTSSRAPSTPTSPRSRRRRRVVARRERADHRASSCSAGSSRSGSG